MKSFSKKKWWLNMVSYDLGEQKTWDYQIAYNKETAERINRIEDKIDKNNSKLNSLTLLVVISLLINIVEFPYTLPIIKTLISFLIKVI